MLRGGIQRAEGSSRRVHPPGGHRRRPGTMTSPLDRSKMGVKYLTANALVDGDFGGGFGSAVAASAARASPATRDSAMALTGIAGVRYVSDFANVDAGLKYQYLHTQVYNFNDAFAVNGTNFTTSAKGNYDFHSLLASLVYNFNSREAASAPIPAAAPAPPPPPPEERQRTVALSWLQAPVRRLHRRRRRRHSAASAGGNLTSSVVMVRLLPWLETTASGARRWRAAQRSAGPQGRNNVSQ